jgi:hypothetical protein
LSKEKRRRAVAALIRRGGAMMPVYASEKKVEGDRTRTPRLFHRVA